jgi:hypothetical protein
MVSWVVLTEVPADALECPLAASELIARLRAESAAMVAALVVLIVLPELLDVPDALEPLELEPAPPPAAPASANGVAPGVAGEPLITFDVLLLPMAGADAAASVD